MNKVILLGRLTKDPDLKFAPGTGVAVCKFTVAIDRVGKKGETDFINCVAFNRNGEFAEKYLKKGMKIAVVGRLQTGSYKNKDGQTIYTTDVVVEEHEFCESKQADGNAQPTPLPTPKAEYDGFMNIADGVDEELPFD